VRKPRVSVRRIASWPVSFPAIWFPGKLE